MNLLFLVGCGLLGKDGAGADDTGAAAGTCDDEGPGPRLMRRLTHEELDNTLHDLLGVTTDAKDTLATDNAVDGFTNNADELDVSSLLADQYRSLAEEVATEADLSTILPCDPTVAGDAPCAATFIEDFGLHAFRRPLAQDDIDRYLALWRTVAADEGFESGIRWVVTAMLQSPHFLYRMELGAAGSDGEYHLTDWEIATELSYLYWRTTPDDELLDAAAAGDLETAEGRAAQVARLSADPRASETVADFFEAWLLLNRLPTVTRDTSVYPEFTDTIRQDMRGETRRLVEDKANDTLGALFSARYTYVTPSLAQFYGLDPTTDDWTRVELDGAKYGGLLTQGSVLATWALPTSSSPIHRGLFVRERLLCQDLPPPPSNLNVSPPPVDPSKSTRERYAEHASLPECSGCHNMIDPIGFGFEHYDGVGRWRADDGGHEIDATGEIMQSPHTNATFDGVFELADVLGRSPDVQACYAKMWTEWGIGLAADGPSCAAEHLADATNPGDLPLLAPLDAITGYQHFTARTGTAGDGDTPAAGERLTTPDVPEDVDTGSGPVAGDDANVDWTPSTNDWGSGYCTTIDATNSSTASVTWQIRVPQDGTVSNSWCVTMTPDGSDWVLTGGGGCGNEQLAAGATTSFGWCANK
jgi:hypothetical protein